MYAKKLEEIQDLPIDVFLSKVKDDDVLKEQLKSAVDIEKITAIAQNAGINITSEEIAKFLASRVVALPDKALFEMAGIRQGAIVGLACWNTCSRNSRGLC